MTDKKRKQTMFLSSKLGKRIFLAFFLCAILPLLTISAGSWLYMGDQLQKAATKRLHQQCKNKGLLIYERLVTLEKELKIIAEDQLPFPMRRFKLDPTPYDPIKREGSGWRRVFLWQPPEKPVTIANNVENPAELMIDLSMAPSGDRTVLRIQHSDDISPTMLMLRYIDPKEPKRGMIGGEINPLYLWGIGVSGVLPPEIELTVLLPSQKVLISSIHDYLISTPFIEAYAESPFSGRFENQMNGKTYVNSYWSLFLKHQFDSQDWTIIFSQTKSSIMAPVSSFRLIFVLFVLLTFWIIMFFSIRSIRKKTGPVEKLKQAALKIADGDLGYRIDVKSGDEFEILADTFNEMSAKLAQNQTLLLQAAKMSTFGQMSAGIVHEIGQPLSGMSGFVELLKLTTLDEKQLRYVDTIYREIDRLSGIIKKFRSYSRVSKEVFQQVDLNAIVKQVETLLSHQLRMKDITFDLSLPERIQPIQGDPDGLQQVLMNLITNAMDALSEKRGEKRTIAVTIRDHSDAVHIEVADNGCGIPEGIQPSIFDPFFTTKSEDKGTGLGLAIISSILHKHNGTIAVDSREDQGTRFTLTFPRLKPSAPAKSLPEAADGPRAESTPGTRP